ncbi:hypothetical protein Sru01_45940 [Sphaerisporangium rufum]|uniref:DUF4143 domain-containing protein n=1 Tax=Sphaerisporangium rufum TaxID=1381558 RepID=A0A919R986_9ACTN|nr:DUF4143 domain-containing protein [Sphaerisporangium rufum]GII79612.1 hypothetical protein Sru01_45940 [Sphaerisporangium rufum]
MPRDQVAAVFAGAPVVDDRRFRTFVYTELLKAGSSAETVVSLQHFRERDDREIDFILETRDGRIVAIEVKASSSPPRDATRQLRRLRDKLGDRFVHGVLLYLGEHTLSHGDRITAVPISALWGHAGLARGAATAPGAGEPE